MLVDAVQTNIEMILYVTGAITAGVALVAVAPAAVLQMLVGVQPGDHVGIFFARHWAIVVTIVGVLLMAAASQANLREPILIAACVSKGAFVLMILANLSNGLGKGLVPALLFDAVCVILYLLYLFG
ncbi:MAG: hypothetical protein NXI24_23570 [bacterium]|nr:hypothetical protein [bacterium]